MIKNVIILQFEDKIEAWGSLTKLCKAHPELSYNYLKSKNYPFKSKGFSFKKIKYNY